MKKILLITTGGTISCDSTQSGLAPQLDGERLLSFISIDNDVQVEVDDLLLLDSTAIKPEHWVRIAEKIKSSEEEYDGFVVTHGTDTMSYTAAMLSFLLFGFSKSVIITGSMKAMIEDNSDATVNLENAVRAAKKAPRGVFVLFGSRIMRGIDSYKLSTEDFDGFISPKSNYAGAVKDGEPEFFPLENIDDCEIESAVTKLSAKVGAVMMLPGEGCEIIKKYTELRYDGIIVIAYGTGGLPDKEWETALKEASQAGICLAMVSQCRRGRIDTDRYSVGGGLQELGIISCRDMGLETAYCKLLWLLSRFHDTAEIKRLFSLSLCGE